MKGCLLRLLFLFLVILFYGTSRAQGQIYADKVAFYKIYGKVLAEQKITAGEIKNMMGFAKADESSTLYADKVFFRFTGSNDLGVLTSAEAVYETDVTRLSKTTNAELATMFDAGIVNDFLSGYNDSDLINVQLLNTTYRGTDAVSFNLWL